MMATIRCSSATPGRPAALFASMEASSRAVLPARRLVVAWMIPINSMRKKKTTPIPSKDSFKPSNTIRRSLFLSASRKTGDKRLKSRPVHRNKAMSQTPFASAQGHIPFARPLHGPKKQTRHHLMAPCHEIPWMAAVPIFTSGHLLGEWLEAITVPSHAEQPPSQPLHTLATLHLAGERRILIL